jgi:hypothetical protein
MRQINYAEMNINILPKILIGYIRQSKVVRFLGLK